MMSRKLILVSGVSVIVLAGLVLLARAPAEAGAKAVPAPDPLKRAEDELRRAEKELDDLEQAFVEQRVKARLDLAQKVERLRAFESEHPAQEGTAATRMKHLQARLHQLRESVANPDREPTVRQLEARIVELRKEVETREDKRKKEGPVLQKEVLLTEEHLRSLDQRQDHRRRAAVARLEAAEARLEVARGGRPEGSAERRLRDVERKLDQLLREMAELRRKVDRSPEQKK